MDVRDRVGIDSRLGCKGKNLFFGVDLLILVVDAIREEKNKKHAVIFGEAMKTEPKKQNCPNEEGLTPPVLSHPKMTLRFSSADIRFVPPIVLIESVGIYLLVENERTEQLLRTLVRKLTGRVGLVFAKGTKSDANKLADERSTSVSLNSA